MISLTWDYQELTDIIMDMLWISHKTQLLKTLRYIADIINHIFPTSNIQFLSTRDTANGF